MNKFLCARCLQISHQDCVKKIILVNELKSSYDYKSIYNYPVYQDIYKASLFDSVSIKEECEILFNELEK